MAHGTRVVDGNAPLLKGVAPLAAPQAALMESLASGIFGAGINWRFIFIGFGQNDQ